MIKKEEENIPQILIYDLGSQYTLIIARILRELGYRSAVLSGEKFDFWLKKYKKNIKAIILSGGYSSVNDKNAPKIKDNVWKSNIPVLGICYGMQYMMKEFGGEIKSIVGHSEYGYAEVDITSDDILMNGIDGTQKVWASHGDTVQKLGSGFKTIAESKKYPFCAVSNEDKKMWGVQFHPEVKETENGSKIFENFIKFSNIKKDWNPDDVVKKIQKQISEKITKDDKVIIGFSGGVDSVTLSMILLPILGDRLIPITIDVGQFRESEIEEVKDIANKIGVKLKVIDKTELMLSKIKGITDAEKKREVFRKIYKNIFDEEIKKAGVKYIAQGSLATDLIESGVTGGALIKTHHNVDLKFGIQELHPLKDLFKYEVREISKKLGAPEKIFNRKPFPGPGLYLRVIGGEVTEKRLKLVKWADKKVSEILRKNNVENEISQLVVAIACLNTVGVKGDSRVYGPAIIVRAIKTVDFMTADGYQFSEDIRREITIEITKNKDIVRVWFDETSKPPATTEFE